MRTTHVSLAVVLCAALAGCTHPTSTYGPPGYSPYNNSAYITPVYTGAPTTAGVVIPSTSLAMPMVNGVPVAGMPPQGQLAYGQPTNALSRSDSPLGIGGDGQIGPRKNGWPRHLNTASYPGSKSDRLRRRFVKASAEAASVNNPDNQQRADGVPSTPNQDLHYRGGRTIRDVQFINIYVGGNTAWNADDRHSIDKALNAAMSDPHLNNVITQYFNNQPVSSKFIHSYFLEGYRPQLVTQGDVEGMMRWLSAQGFTKKFDLPNTIINVMLPPGCVLNDDTHPSNGILTAQRSAASNSPAGRDPRDPLTDSALDEFPSRAAPSFIPKADEGDSKTGLGGYHGSVKYNNETIYYAVGVYSQRLPDGTANGIPGFDKPWKNVVATFYHELQEARTDPDVEDVIRDPYAGNALGWTSEAGEEIGDFPVDEANQLSLVFKEVPLADGSGTVPIQLMYSNAVHGPEGPIPTPHPTAAK